MRDTHRFNPWRLLRDLGPSWRLKWSRGLPSDTYGKTNWGTRTITLAEGMSFEERRCTITHEVTHVLRGPASACDGAGEELEVDRISARLLLPSVRDIADCLVYHRGHHDRAAADLWVDPWMLEVRLSGLCGVEGDYLRRRIDDVILLAVDEVGVQRTVLSVPRQDELRVDQRTDLRVEVTGGVAMTPAARRTAARVQLPNIKDIGEAMAWALSTEEAASELQVAVEVLRDRLHWLHPAEQHYLRHRLEGID